MPEPNFDKNDHFEIPCVRCGEMAYTIDKKKHLSGHTVKRPIQKATSTTEKIVEYSKEKERKKKRKIKNKNFVPGWLVILTLVALFLIIRGFAIKLSSP